MRTMRVQIQKQQETKTKSKNENSQFINTFAYIELICIDTYDNIKIHTTCNGIIRIHTQTSIHISSFHVDYHIRT